MPGVSTPDPAGESIALYVVCRSDATAAAWRARAAKLENLDIRPILGAKSYYRVIDGLIGGDDARPALLCHDDIRCGFDFAEAVAQLLAELERNYARWGVCGNAGISPDGKRVIRHVRDPHGGPDPGLDIDPVMVVDGNMLLLNLPALRAAGVRLPEFDGFHGYDVALSVECWLAGLAVLCDRRLFVIHKSGGDQRGFDRFCRGEVFGRYLASRLVNHILPTMNGPLDFGRYQSYGHLDYAQAADGRQDVVAAFDRTLAACRRKVPELTIACRSRLDRPELLERAVTSFAVAALEAPELVSIGVALVSDRPAAELEAAAARLRERFPGLSLRTVHAAATDGRYGRVAALLRAVESCEGDYLWIVDDDDFVYPSAVRPVARQLAAGIPRMVVGHVRRFEERWSSPQEGPRVLRASREIAKMPAEGIYRAFDGDNHTPVCGAILPLGVLKDRVRRVAARGDYYEDYFILLLALTSPRIEVVCVDADVCGVSLRAGENTVNQPEREHWDLSYATFVNEILRLPAATSPLLWQLARQGRQTPAQVLAAALRATGHRLHPRLWPLLVRRVLLHLRHEGWRATLARVRNYLVR